MKSNIYIRRVGLESSRKISEAKLKHFALVSFLCLSLNSSFSFLLKSILTATCKNEINCMLNQLSLEGKL